jgi:hypothetical protein
MRLPFRILAGVVLVLFAFAVLLPDNEEPVDPPVVQETVSPPVDEPITATAESEVPVEQPVTETCRNPDPTAGSW